ncbi:MAG: ATP-binding protein [Bacteroidia bacterium]|nr:ATP-binding protein [Bacteroidia bacterium]
MLRIQRPYLSNNAEFSLATGRIVLGLSPFVVLIARMTDLHADQLTLFNDILVFVIVTFSLLVLALSYTQKQVVSHLYFYILGVLALHGLDSYYNLHLFHFAEPVKHSTLVFCFISVWFIRSRPHLIVHLILLLLALLVTYALTPSREPGAEGYLIQFVLVEVMLYILVGTRVYTINRLLSTDLQYRQLIEGLNEGILQTNQDGVIQVVNERFCEMTGYNREVLLEDMRIGTLIAREDKDIFQQKQVERLRGTADRYEIRLIRRDGSLIWVQVSSTPIIGRDGVVTGATSILIDITASKLTMLERDRFQYEMDYLRQELTIKNQEMEQFAQIASVDMKTPLEEISMAAEQQLINHPELPDASRQALVRIIRNCGQMGQMVDALLLYSLSGLKNMTRQLVDLTEVVKDVQDSLQSHIVQHQVMIRHDELPQVMADRVQMFRLFHNMVENAIKHRSANQPVIHIAYSQHTERQEYVFSVEDNGIGIDKSDYDKIFVIFQKGTMESDGAGVGLAICKKIISNHGGRLWLTSSAGKGTIFYFSLPVPGAQPEPDADVVLKKIA